MLTSIQGTRSIRPQVGSLGRQCCLAGHLREFASAVCPRALLGVDARCTVEEVKEAYRRRAKEWHPDICSGDKQQAVKRFQELQEAYKGLLEELQSGRKPSSGPSQAHGAATQKPEWAGGAREWQNAREWAEQVDAATASPQQPLVMGLGGAMRSILRGLAAMSAGLLFWILYDARSARRQEIEDEMEFGAKKARLRQDAAKAQQEVLSRRTTRQQQIDDRINYAERVA
eukprot:CAMPEP_0178407144 /NCGR_PEP_ID=MMETSP0689_2-20121128/19276_1 /TAXON_ID=160604 /ORGANISM="Amphidinium massartii, Strain CS-259" /LENGTH=228 /DNA_ID=CAMNT_0020028207 /DNA_START=80 /DNA_END=763 /DNA_ORIENTATION=-